MYYMYINKNFVHQVGNQPRKFMFFLVSLYSQFCVSSEELFIQISHTFTMLVTNCIFVIKVVFSLVDFPFLLLQCAAYLQIFSDVNGVVIYY